MECFRFMMNGVKHEYHEGKQAGENFEKLARAVFQAPKVANPKRQPQKPTRRKKTGSDKG
jgi:hypothetical protein